jgi:hypothetical protein
MYSQYPTWLLILNLYKLPYISKIATKKGRKTTAYGYYYTKGKVKADKAGK